MLVSMWLCKQPIEITVISLLYKTIENKNTLVIIFSLFKNECASLQQLTHSMSALVINFFLSKKQKHVSLMCSRMQIYFTDF